MAKLTGQTIADSYDQLLIVDNASGISASLQAIEAGDTGGSASSLKISTSKCEVIPASDSTALFEVSQANGTAVLSVDTSNARVGIGNASPACDLHIGGTNPQIRIGDDGAEDTSLCFMGNAQDFYIALDDTTDDLTIGTGTTIGSNVKMVVENGGYVGIGTVAPAVNLEVESSSGDCTIRAIGSDSNHGILELWADDGDDEDDGYQILGHGNEGLYFRTSNNAGLTGTPGWDNRMIIRHSDGNIGIGTDSPNKLSFAADNTVLTMSGRSADGYSILEMGSYDTDANDDLLGGIYFYDNMGTGTLELNGTIAVHRDAAYKGRMTFSTSDESGSNTTVTERMRIDPNGNVGIGTTTPMHELTISSPSTAGAALELKYAGDADPTAGTAISNQVLGEILFSGNDSNINAASGGAQADNSSIGAKIVATATAAWGAAGNDNDDSPTKLEFFTQSDGTGETLDAARMTILSNGNVGIGVIDPDTNLEVVGSSGANAAIKINAISGDASYYWNVNNGTHWVCTTDGGNGDIQWFDNDGTAAAKMNRDDTDWEAASDERIKENLESLTDAVSKINTFRAVTYNHKYGSEASKAKKRVGLIAQDVVKVLPEAVGGIGRTFEEIPARDAVKDDAGNIQKEAVPYKTYKGELSLAYTRIVPLLVKAIQELSAKVTALENA